MARAPSSTSTRRRRWRRHGADEDVPPASISTTRSPTGNNGGLESLHLPGGRGFMDSNIVARRCAMFFLALSVCVAGARYMTEAHAAGAFSVGKCGAYGQAFDYGAEHEARAAAQKQCRGDCTTVTMKRACAAMAVDLANPCGAYGYAVKPKISATLNAATRECYKFGGKECVIRAWACDAKG